MDKGGGLSSRPGSKERRATCRYHHGGERLRTDSGDLKGYLVSGLSK